MKSFQVQDACHKGVLDGAHTRLRLTGMARTRPRRCSAPVLCLAPTASQILAWVHYGGGKELYRELVQDILKLNLVGFFCMPMPTQPLGLVLRARSSQQTR